MWLVPIPLLAWLVVAFCEETASTANVSPCDDFHKYICSRPNSGELNARFPDVRSLKVSEEIEQYQEYVFPTTEPGKRLWDVIDPDLISLWLVQFTTYVDGPNWKEHQRRHERTMNLTREEMHTALELQIEPFPMKILTRFYTSLKTSCERLAELKMPISTHNHYYHGVFDELKELHISEIKKYSRYNEEQKQKLIDKVNNVKVIFPFFEYNNVTVWRQAKAAYEREYYRLKALINETELPEQRVEQIILVASVAPAMEIFTKYINKFTPKFVFQHVIATSTRDSFNYHSEIHASILTFMNPQTHPEDVYRRFLYVLSHELQHVFYNTDPPLFEPEMWAKERQCLVDKINFFGQHWKRTVPDRDLENVYYEDMSNVAGLRLTVVLNAQRASEPQEIRTALERSLSFMCQNLNLSTYHNPLDLSVNVAASQLPTFNILYNCTPEDRMYVKTEDLCTTLNMAIEGADYERQKIDEDELFVLTKFMDVLENTADELDAANITMFEGELFDITVEDVEDQEEIKEGSASSSSSESSEEKEGEDDDELTDALEDAEKAEIVSTGNVPFTVLVLGVVIGVGLVRN